MNRLIQLQTEQNALHKNKGPKSKSKIRRRERSAPMSWSASLHNYSIAKGFNTWEEVTDATISPSLSYGNRLDEIVAEPWLLDQNQEGNCGFAAAIMAMLDITSKNLQLGQASAETVTDGKRSKLIPLLDAIYTSKAIAPNQNGSNQYQYESEYRTLRATSKDSNSSRDGKAIIQNRLEKRLAHHPDLGELMPYLADYVLIVGLMLFFKDHVKKNNGNLWNELVQFNKDVGHTWPQTHLKELGITDITPSGPKKGDFALTVNGMLELCRHLGITTEHYTDNDLSTYQQQQEAPRQTRKKFEKETFGTYGQHRGGIRTLDVMNSRNHGKVTLATAPGNKIRWRDLQWPCIVGVYDKDHFNDPKTEKFSQTVLKTYMPYNLLTHWIYMPSADEAWSWGYTADLNETDYAPDEDTEYDIQKFVPMEVISVDIQ